MKKSVRRLVLLVVATAVFLPLGSGQPDEAADGRQPWEPLWTLTFDDSVSVESLSSDGSLLVGLKISGEGVSHSLFAVDKRGQLLWEKKAPREQWQKALLSPDGKFVCGLERETIIPRSDAVKYTSHFFDASGKELWCKEIQGIPTFSPDNTYLVYQPPATEGGPVYLVDVEGTVVAKVDVEVAYPYRFFFTPDGGYIFFSTNKGAIGIDRSGKVVWEDSPCTFVAALSPDGAYLILARSYQFSSSANAIACLDAEKKVVWTRDFGQGPYCDVLGFAGNTGHVLLQLWEGPRYDLWLVNPSGEIVWRRDLGEIDSLTKFDASPDGSLALMVRTCGEPPGQAARIFSPLTDTTIWEALWPPAMQYCFSADGHYLATSYQRELSLYSISAAGAPSSGAVVPEPARTTTPSPSPCPSQG